MKQEFKLHESCNTFSEDTTEIIVDFDEVEIEIRESCGSLVTLQGINRDLKELKRLHRCLGDLIREME